MVLGKESQEGTQDNEGEAEVDGDGSSFSMSEEEDHLGRVEGFVACKYDGDKIAFVRTSRESHSVGT